jgi:hypothetical protein
MRRCLVEVRASHSLLSRPAARTLATESTSAPTPAAEPKAAAVETAAAAAPSTLIGEKKAAAPVNAPAADAKPADEAQVEAAAFAQTGVTSGSDSMHSTDIAFKPNNAGWGYNPKYAASFENIFGAKKVDPVKATKQVSAKKADLDSIFGKKK